MKATFIDCETGKVIPPGKLFIEPPKFTPLPPSSVGKGSRRYPFIVPRAELAQRYANKTGLDACCQTPDGKVCRYSPNVPPRFLYQTPV